MKVIVAKTLGFCYGVRKAINAVLIASTKSDHPNIQTFGPLIHNKQALRLIEKYKISVATDSTMVKNGTLIIRAHGIPIDQLQKIEAHQTNNDQLNIVNATCPEVLKVQYKIRKWSPKGYFTVIVGVHDHAESIAHQSYAKYDSAIISTLDEAKELMRHGLDKVLIVAQTTFIHTKFKIIAEYIKQRSESCIIDNTICKDTYIRHNEAKRIAQIADCVIIIGSKTSSNTQHLTEIINNANKPMQYINNANEIDFAQLAKYKIVGILAGASTPTWLIDSIVNILQQYEPINKKTII